jgi:hypothetical protein
VTQGDQPKNYIRVRIDDPILGEPLRATLFPSDSGNSADLVWNRRKKDEQLGELHLRTPEEAKAGLCPF